MTFCAKLLLCVVHFQENQNSNLLRSIQLRIVQDNGKRHERKFFFFTLIGDIDSIVYIEIRSKVSNVRFRCFVSVQLLCVFGAKLNWLNRNRRRNIEQKNERGEECRRKTPTKYIEGILPCVLVTSNSIL